MYSLVYFCDGKDGLAHWLVWVLGALWSGGDCDDDGGHVLNGLRYIVAMNKLKMVGNVLQRLVKLGGIVWPGIIKRVELDLLGLPPEFA